MGTELSAALKPHEVARIDIERWRGHCLDLFARGEGSIGRTLEALKVSPKFEPDVKLQHLAGQRADEIARLLPECGLTAKQSKGAADALRTWREFEAPRNFLAHGVLTIALDAKGAWFAIFDMTVFRSGVAEPQRWASAQCEARELDAKLRQSGQALAQHLGQLRKKFGDSSAA